MTLDDTLSEIEKKWPLELKEAQPASDTKRSMEIAENSTAAATCQNCAICKEGAQIIPLHGRWFVRVRRISKCKRRICKTEWRDSKKEAVADWNIQFGEWVDVEEAARAFAGKANLCTHAGIYGLALPLFREVIAARKASRPLAAASRHEVITPPGEPKDQFPKISVTSILSGEKKENGFC